MPGRAGETDMNSEHATSAARAIAQTDTAAETRRPADFVDTLFGRVSPEDLAAYSPDTLAALSDKAYEHLRASRQDQMPDLRLLDIEVQRNGRSRDVTILEIVNDNMPFLLESTLGELVEQGYEPKF